MKTFLVILASEVKGELIEFTHGSNLDRTAGRKCEYHGGVVTLNEKKNRNEEKFRRSSSQE